VIDKGWVVLYHDDTEGYFVVNCIEGIPDTKDVLAGPFDTHEEAEKAGYELEQKYS